MRAITLTVTRAIIERAKAGNNGAVNLKVLLDAARAGQPNPLTIMPPICVEVISPGNRRKDIEAKVQAYLTAGVHEVLLVEQDGRLRWFTAKGEHSQSVHGVALHLPD